MFKLFMVAAVFFALGYTLANTDEKEIREKMNLIAEKSKKLSTSAKEIFYNSLNNLENLNSDEIKVNFGRLLDFIKNKLDELLALESVQDKLNYSKETLSNVKKISKNKIQELKENKYDKENEIN